MKHPKNYCECGKLKDKRAKYCRPCANKKERNPYWKGGKPKCKDCEMLLKSYEGVRCHSCANKKYRHWNYINDK